jgi:hypothetical protein
MPIIEISSGDSILIATENSNLDSAVATANFNLRLGEGLKLTDFDGNILSLVEVSLVRGGNKVQHRMRNGNFVIKEID